MGYLNETSVEPSSPEAHVQWLAEWLRGWPGVSPAERAQHFRSLAKEISARAEGMPDPHARLTLMHIADRYVRMAERNERPDALVSPS